MEYRKVNIHDDHINSQPMIKIPSSAFGTLRRELLDTLGSERAKGFLLRYGWNCGVADGKQMMERDWENAKDLLLAGPRMHTSNGHAEVESHVCEVDIDKGTLHFEGDWKHSNEAKEHLKLYGLSKEPVCHSLVGYASGYLSTVMGKKVIARETQCMAMGHEHCHWICKTIDEWGKDPDIEKERHFYEEDRISEELEETYEKLRIERDNLSKTYHVHLQLFKEVIYETGIQSLAEVLYKMMKTSVIIENLNCEPRAVAGITSREAEGYCQEFKEWLAKSRNKNREEKIEINETRFVEISPGHKRMVAPIYFRQNIYGYCSILTEGDTAHEADKMVLGQAALACSLHLLNERTRFNTEQRIRGGFLDDILRKRITGAEIIERAHFIDFEIKGPYFIIAIQRQFEETSIKEEMEFNDGFMNDLFKFLQSKGIKAVLGQKSRNVIILFSEASLANSAWSKKSLCEQFVLFCQERYPQFLFHIGVSSSKSSIEEASRIYDESTASLKIANSHQNLVFFDSLGMVGLLLQTENPEAIENFAYKVLGNLIEEDKSKNNELTHTLYYYLENGSNVHKTARAMNFSISGLRYRLGRINEILQLDISQAYHRHEIYLALQCLIVLGELEL